MEQQPPPLSMDELAIWCEHRLGAQPARTLFTAGHLSAVIGLQLTDGREVVVKTLPPSERLRACVQVQRHLWSAGYPCPEPLAGPVPLGALTATVEAFVPGGVQLKRTRDTPRCFAEALAELAALAPPAAMLPTLEPPPAWAWWDHDQPGIWPAPDDRIADLNADPESAWLDDAGRRARRLARCQEPPVVGHADWESQNLRWIGSRLHVVHDWDSVASRPEAALAGAASAVFPASGAPLTEATLEETGAFLAAYERARGRPWSEDERQVCWAAGLWIRSFNAKKEAVMGTGGPILTRLAGEVAERLRQAGA